MISPLRTPEEGRARRPSGSFTWVSMIERILVRERRRMRNLRK
jgi:hypothetical protein